MSKTHIPHPTCPCTTSDQLLTPLPSPCFLCSSSSLSGGFPPLAFHKVLGVFVCPSYNPSLSPVPGVDIFPVVSSTAFLCLQHSQDSCLGIPLVFSNFLLSGQCKNSFGLLIPSFIDYFSSLRFYHSPSLRTLPWALLFHPAEGWVCSRLVGTCSPSPGESCLIPSLLIAAQNVALLRSPQTSWQRRGCVVL